MVFSDWKWIDTVPYWCTQLGRSLVVKNASAEQCQRFCDEGCEAVEWWEGDGNACHICTDLSLHMFFGITSDTSYPPHVFIKEPGMLVQKLAFKLFLRSVLHYQPREISRLIQRGFTRIPIPLEVQNMSKKSGPWGTFWRTM